MKIERVTVEVLETPVDLQYVAAGNAVSSNWHVLSRVYTSDGSRVSASPWPPGPRWCRPWPKPPESWGRAWWG
jgi:hypothetical protein